ncbi:hypothetical protein METHB2_20115 [Candidatus Methylobacter favarea]|uniref:Uncharacterized protein n=1 Tax=Candidatus Methylobacter favarea TaxID=2707345 RepID=A0A8S0XF56_9GAMM|nr:hypothetical protein METHB2_20115 [Candidatus Methylobacter favarea]
MAPVIIHKTKVSNLQSITCTYQIRQLVMQGAMEYKTTAAFVLCEDFQAGIVAYCFNY